jgi:hypothetical protein
MVGGADAVGAGGVLHEGLSVPDHQAVHLLPILACADIHLQILREGIGGVDLSVHRHDYVVSLLPKEVQKERQQSQDGQQASDKNEIVPELSSAF